MSCKEIIKSVNPLLFVKKGERERERGGGRRELSIDIRINEYLISIEDERERGREGGSKYKYLMFFLVLSFLQGVAPYLISPVQGFEELDNLKVQTAPGCDVNCEVTDDFQDALDIAVKADAVIVVLGLDQSHERFKMIL